MNTLVYQFKASVLLSLTGIAANGPHDPTTGICGNVREDVELFSWTWLEPYFERWPEAASRSVPVEGSVAVYRRTQRQRWDIDTVFGAKRYRLLAFLIHELTKELHDE